MLMAALGATLLEPVALYLPDFIRHFRIDGDFPSPHSDASSTRHSGR